MDMIYIIPFSSRGRGEGEGGIRPCNCFIFAINPFRLLHLWVMLSPMGKRVKVWGKEYLNSLLMLRLAR